MKQRKKYLTALAVFSATIGTSHLMQSNWSVSAYDASLEEAAPLPARDSPAGDTVVAIAQDVTSGADKPAVGGFATSGPKLGAASLFPFGKPVVLPVKLEDENAAPAPLPIIAVPEMPRDIASPDPLPTPGPSPLDRLSMTGDGTDADPDGATPVVNEYGLACGAILSAAERPAAMVNLTVTAPCRGGERITVRHDGLVFSATLNALGIYMREVPALSDNASFGISFQDGEIAWTELTVAGASQTERVVLQFNGRTGLQIHALEFGADYGAPGHVWAGNARDAETAVKMGGGYLTVLGDPNLPDAFLAEVYTLPSEITGRDGVVRLNVEAEVTVDNCARTIAGQTFQRQTDGYMTPVALTLSMPDCDAVGEFLVLKNLLRDLKIASN